MSRLLLCALLPCLYSSAFAQPDLNTPGKKENPVAQPFIPPDLDPLRQLPKSPEDAAVYFLNALKSPDEINLTRAVAGARIGYYGSGEWEETRRDIYSLAWLPQLKVDAIKVTDETATDAVVSITAHRELISPGRAPERLPPTTYTLPVRWEKDVFATGLGRSMDMWRVVPLSNEQIMAQPVWSLPPLQLMATFALHDKNLLPYLRQQRAISQLKQLALGLLQFLEDYDHTFALEDASYKRATSPYVPKESLFVIPTTKDENWRFNDNLSNKKSQEIANPSHTVLFYDGEAPTPDKINFRFGDKTPIGFVDGSCRLVAKEELLTLIWKP